MVCRKPSSPNCSTRRGIPSATVGLGRGIPPATAALGAASLQQLQHSGAASLQQLGNDLNDEFGQSASLLQRK